ncbi:DMT family transporter [Hathewaya limosa]|uniref:Transporter family-2 protein n=1 Tax=Hathewaya limosa TaxID=1536 RepID=A0ABU0JNM6_HATLI|nr:DMT family transporter [Hathewaya limosa]MDQ0478681.1 transporter family-2 protein [Hathewaya limosa]
MGIIFSILAGFLMSIQGVFNTNASKKIGLWETNLIVQGVALVSTLILFYFFRNGSFKEISSLNKLYLTGGIIGTLITITVMLGINKLGPTCSISIILIAQLLTAAIIDALALFNTEKIAFGINKYIGIIMMLIGIIIFKCK